MNQLAISTAIRNRLLADDTVTVGLTQILRNRNERLLPLRSASAKGNKPHVPIRRVLLFGGFPRGSDSLLTFSNTA